MQFVLAFIVILQHLHSVSGLNSSLAGGYTRKMGSSEAKFCTPKYEVKEFDSKNESNRQFSIFTDGDCNLRELDFKREPMSTILGEEEPVPKIDGWVWRGDNSCLGKTVSMAVFYCHEEEQGLVWSRLNREKGQCYFDLGTNESSVCIYQKNCPGGVCSAGNSASTGSSKSNSLGFPRWIIWVGIIVIAIATFALVLFCCGRCQNGFSFRKRPIVSI